MVYEQPNTWHLISYRMCKHPMNITSAVDHYIQACPDFPFLFRVLRISFGFFTILVLFALACTTRNTYC